VKNYHHLVYAAVCCHPRAVSAFLSMLSGAQRSVVAVPFSVGADQRFGLAVLFSGFADRRSVVAAPGGLRVSQRPVVAAVCVPPEYCPRRYPVPTYLPTAPRTNFRGAGEFLGPGFQSRS